MKMRERLETRQPPFFLPRSKKAPNFPAQGGGLFVQKLLVSPPFTLPSLHSAIHIMHFTQACAPVQCSLSPPKKHTMPLVPACNPRVGLTNNNSGDAGFLHYPDTDFDAFLAGTRYPSGWTMEFLNRTLVHDSFGCS